MGSTEGIPHDTRSRRIYNIKGHELYSVIGNRITYYRLREKMTQEDLGANVGLGRTSIVNLEAGRQSVPLHILYAIAEWLDVEITDLLP